MVQGNFKTYTRVKMLMHRLHRMVCDVTFFMLGFMMFLANDVTVISHQDVSNYPF